MVAVIVADGAGRKEGGPVAILAISGVVGGAAQLAMYTRMRKPIRSMLLLPGRLWLAVVVGFVCYLLLINGALIMAMDQGESATIGVSLMNYLWPTFTVIFAVLLVRGVKATWRLAAATVISLAGLVVANWDRLAAAFGGTSNTQSHPSLLPYAMAGLAAVMWGLYSVLVSRWREWAREYATSPAGFLLVGAIATAICTIKGEWRAMDAAAWTVVCLYGLLPSAVGYMFWELALHRAPAKALGLMGAATPILSTLALLAVFAMTDLGKEEGQPPLGRLLAGAAMVAVRLC